MTIDYGWSLNSSLRYARRQVLMMKAIKEKNIDFEEVIQLIRTNLTEMEAELNLVEKYGIEKVVAHEILETDIRKLFSLDIDRELVYYSRASEVLTPLVKEYHKLA